MAPVASSPAAGTITGVVSTKEAAPSPIRVTIDPSVCGQTLPDETILVDAAGHVANAVVMIAGLKGTQPAEVLVANEKCRFAPRVSIMRPGGALKMTSRDPTLHTMHAAPAGGAALFNLSLPIPNMTLTRTIAKPGVVTLSCSTHTWMRGYLHVTDAVAATSGADGKFTLEGVPAGTHELSFWHEALKAPPMKVTVKDGETVTVAVTLGR
jgi:plastocyanin